VNRGALVRQVARPHELRGGRTRWRTLVQTTAIAMIAVSVGVIGATLVGRRHYLCEAPPPADRTKLFLRQLAFEAFPAWQASQGDTSCPTIHELVRWTSASGGEVRDAWDQPIEIRCGEPLPGSVHGLLLRSAGPDGEFGTDDDVTL
jgi:hypothetical protein